MLTIKDKYHLYESSVQCHEADVDFINDEYKKIYGKNPNILREDFGGTGLLACSWVKQSADHQAYAIDLDPEPIAYGKENHYMRLDTDQQSRMHYLQENVLSDFAFKADIAVAFNFSYFIFKKRKELIEYFSRVREGLSDEGLFLLDIFGGTDAYEESVEETEHEDHSYFWDCDHYNPLTNECLYYIHFKKDGVKHNKVFTYDWRMWSVVEIREILIEAGFSKTVAYWEGTDEDGDGDGNFYQSEEEENCESWVTYIAAIP